MRSAARPEPSHITTGTGGVSVTYSKTALIVFVPPSITKHTTGVLECVTIIFKHIQELKQAATMKTKQKRQQK